jgi:hypothetical protein
MEGVARQRRQPRKHPIKCLFGYYAALHGHFSGIFARPCLAVIRDPSLAGRVHERIAVPHRTFREKTHQSVLKIERSVVFLRQSLSRQPNPAGERKVERFGWTFAPGDKVMQIENDYDKDAGFAAQSAFCTVMEM